MSTIKNIIKNIFSIDRKIGATLRKRYSSFHVTRPYEINLSDHGRFQEKVAVVIGGSGAIGRACCCRLAAEGANVIVCGTHNESIQPVVNEIIALGYKANACIINVKDDDDITLKFEKLISQFGHIDIFIYTAGGSAREKHANIVSQDFSVIDNMLTTNLRGAIFCSQKAAIQMRKQKSGKIIFISSVIGLQGKAGYSEYAASKAGIIAYTKSLAMELGKGGINVNCISPGIVQRGEVTPEIIDKITKTNYSYTYGKPEDIANAAAFLASDESSFIIGQNIIVDGGRCLGLRGD